MSSNNKYAIITVSVLLGIILQVVFIAADLRETPSRVAVKYAKAYFKLKPSMADYLCSETAQGPKDVYVDEHIYAASQVARDRGYKTSFMKSTLYNIKTHTVNATDTTAQVQLTAQTRISVCPFFSWVAQIFQLGETYNVEASIDVVKEDGQWKVCGSPLAIPHV